MANNSLYRQEILDHARNPRNYGKLKGADASVHEANLSCGDEVTLYFKYGKSGGKKVLAETAFEGRGCILCLAGASMLTEHINKRTLDSIKKIKEGDILELFGSNLTPSRQRCALLSFEALQKKLK